jgi:anhydro-N-acetylmuramic acid kinase
MFEGLRRVLGANTVTADEAGFSADFMEAQAFAYLAVRRLKELPSSFAGTTGVSEPAVGGLVADANARQPNPVNAEVLGA